MNHMMSPADDSQSSAPRKSAAAASSVAVQAPPPEHGLKCPRCDSPNTKFCYYNNYSLTQPRHFCKTCRRYWTKGGALRNVPVGGGCRKAKKSKPAPAPPSSAASLRLPTGPACEPGGGLRFFEGLSAAAMDLQLGVLPFPKLHSTAAGVFNGGQLLSFGDFSDSSANPNPHPNPMMGFNYPAYYSEVNVSSSSLNGNANSSIASSIESLSSINQELHWKLQQQRLAMLIGEESHKESAAVPLLESQPEIASFQLPTEATKANGSTAWFLDSNYTSAAAVNDSSSNGSGGGRGGTSGSWSGVQTWNDMHQFTALP